MTQVVARLDDELAAAIDELVSEGKVASRSEAVRIGLVRLVEDHRRREIGDRIVAGYATLPQTESEVGRSDASTIAMIAEEPW